MTEPAPLGEFVKRERFCALHVGGVAGQKQKRRRCARAKPVSDRSAGNVETENVGSRSFSRVIRAASPSFSRILVDLLLGVPVRRRKRPHRVATSLKYVMIVELAPRLPLVGRHAAIKHIGKPEERHVRDEPARGSRSHQ